MNSLYQRPLSMCTLMVFGIWLFHFIIILTDFSNSKQDLIYRSKYLVLNGKGLNALKCTITVGVHLSHLSFLAFYNTKKMATQSHLYEETHSFNESLCIACWLYDKTEYFSHSLCKKKKNTITKKSKCGTLLASHDLLSKVLGREKNGCSKIT